MVCGSFYKEIKWLRQDISIEAVFTTKKNSFLVKKKQNKIYIYIFNIRILEYVNDVHEILSLYVEDIIPTSKRQKNKSKFLLLCFPNVSKVISPQSAPLRIWSLELCVFQKQNSWRKSIHLFCKLSSRHSLTLFVENLQIFSETQTNWPN